MSLRSASRVVHGAIAEGAGLVLVVLGDKRQGFGEGEVFAAQLGAKVVEVAHYFFPLLKAACCSALASFWYLAFHSAYGMP